MQIMLFRLSKKAILKIYNSNLNWPKFRTSHYYVFSGASLSVSSPIRCITVQEAFLFTALHYHLEDIVYN